MFGLFKQSGKAEAQAETPATPAPIVEPILLKDPPDRRKVSGNRVTCQCDFILPNPDPFMHSKMLVTGTIVLNVRGCCVYPEQIMSVDEILKKIPEDKSLTVSNLAITGDDNQKYSLGDVSLRRMRLLNDEHGQGVILRFVGLSERQLDTLIGITEAYSKPD